MVTAHKIRTPEDLKGNNGQATKTRLDLLNRICNNVRSVKQHLPVIQSIAQATRYTLNASAATLILLDEENKAALNKYTDGPLGRQFQQYGLEKQPGITRWVLKNGKPMVIKDVDKEDGSRNARNEVAGVVPRSIICAPIVIEGKVVGAIEVLNKLDGNSFDGHDVQVLTGLADNAALTLENIKSNENQLFSYKNTVGKLVSLLDVRESTAGKHSKRVAEYALMVAKALSLSDEEKRCIEYAAILHDIGMLGVPEAVVNKSGKLTQEEWGMIHKHPVIGYNLLRGIPSLNQVSKLILYHHERYDGKGYPCGLRGNTIPVGARVIAVADAFDSMTVKHSYRAAMSPKNALEEIGRCSASQFCPVVAKAFFKSYMRTKLSGNVKFKNKGLV